MKESERKTPTVDEVKADLARLDQVLAGLTLHHVYTIEDYPIGRKLRGKCELSIQHDCRRGFRTMKRTTDKFGRWCKPKGGTYVKTPIVVVTGPGVPQEAAWLRFERHEVYLLSANMGHTKIYSAPHWHRPNREAETITFRMTTIFGGGAGREEQVVQPADPPELCDAWDVWEAWFKKAIPAIEAKIHACAPVFA